MTKSQEDKDLETITTQLEAAYRYSDGLPPDSDEMVAELASDPSAVPELDIESARRALLQKMATGVTIGRLVADHCRINGTEVEDLARQSGWAADRIEAFEGDQLDLHQVEPSALAGLLFALGLRSVGTVEAPLRRMAQEHLAVYESGAGPMFGRTRKSVGSFDRRRDITRGAVEIDREATARVADVYLKQVQDRLVELSSNRSL